MHANLGCTQSMQLVVPSLPFEDHAMLMAAALEGVEARAQSLAQAIAASEQQCSDLRHQ